MLINIIKNNKNLLINFCKFVSKPGFTVQHLYLKEKGNLLLSPVISYFYKSKSVTQSIFPSLHISEIVYCWLK